METGGSEHEVLRLVYKNNDVVFININSLHKIAKYSGSGETPLLNSLNNQDWVKKKTKIKTKIVDMANDLIQLYLKRREIKGFAFDKDSYLQIELESSFIYQDTPDQIKTTEDVKKDMEGPFPMDRLVCGDVGFGKTEIAIRALIAISVFPNPTSPQTKRSIGKGPSISFLTSSVVLIWSGVSW